MGALEPDKTYLYAGQPYPPDRHGDLPDEAKASLAKQRTETERRPAVVTVAASDALAELVGDEKVAGALREAGYGDVAAIRAASDADLTKLPGIGEATLIKIRTATTPQAG